MCLDMADEIEIEIDSLDFCAVLVARIERRIL